VRPIREFTQIKGAFSTHIGKIDRGFAMKLPFAVKHEREPPKRITVKSVAAKSNCRRVE
jgi:hypothetical protein